MLLHTFYIHHTIHTKSGSGFFFQKFKSGSGSVPVSAIYSTTPLWVSCCLLLTTMCEWRSLLGLGSYYLLRSYLLGY